MNIIQNLVYCANNNYPCQLTPEQSKGLIEQINELIENKNKIVQENNSLIEKIKFLSSIIEDKKQSDILEAPYGNNYAVDALMKESDKIIEETISNAILLRMEQTHDKTAMD